MHGGVHLRLPLKSLRQPMCNDVLSGQIEKKNIKYTVYVIYNPQKLTLMLNGILWNTTNIISKNLVLNITFISQKQYFYYVVGIMIKNLKDLANKCALWASSPCTSKHLALFKTKSSTQINNLVQSKRFYSFAQLNISWSIQILKLGAQGA